MSQIKKIKMNNVKKIKFIDFINFTLLSWNIRDTSIANIYQLSMIVNPKNLYKIISPYEFIILSTCNRVEIYIYSYRNKDLVDEIIKYINDKIKYDGCISKSLDLLNGEKAYEHLLDVTSGLESFALGEYQIQGQVKNAYLDAIKDRHICSYLISIFESALKTGKRVRTETEIGNKNISLSSLAIDIMFQSEEPSKKKPILIAGTGKMSKLAADYLIQKGYSWIIFFSSSPNERTNFATKYHSLIFSIDEIGMYTKKAQFIFAAISPLAPRASLTILENEMSKLSIIDLSVPSYFRKSANKPSFLNIIDMDTIKKKENNYFSKRIPCLTQSKRIINEEIQNFISNNQHRQNLNRFYSSNRIQINN